MGETIQPETNMPPIETAVRAWRTAREEFEREMENIRSQSEGSFTPVIDAVHSTKRIESRTDIDRHEQEVEKEAQKLIPGLVSGDLTTRPELQAFLADVCHVPYSRTTDAIASAWVRNEITVEGNDLHYSALQASETSA